MSISLLFINMAMGIVGSVGLHVFTYTFCFNNRQIAIVFGALFIMALIAQPFWLFGLAILGLAATTVYNFVLSDGMAVMGQTAAIRNNFV